MNKQNNNHDSIEDFLTEIGSGSKIALCSSSYNGKGGDCRVIQQQARDLQESGYDVSIIVLEADIDPPQDVELDVVGRPQSGIVGRTSRLAYPISRSSLSLISRLNSFDTVIAHRYPLTVCGYFASKLYDTEYIYWFHHVVEPKRFSGLARFWVAMLRHLELKNFAATRADYICAVSETSKQDIKKYCNNDVHVVPNKIDAKRFDDQVGAELILNKYGVGDGQTILFVGRITPQKNVLQLMNVYDNLKSEFNSLELVIAGSHSDSSYSERIESKADSNVTFTGFVPDKELAALYQISDVFATCSTSEGWSLTPVEAQHFDTPVVAYQNNESAASTGTSNLVEIGNQAEFENQIRNVLIGDLSSTD